MYTITGVSPEKLEAGLGKLRKSGFKVEDNRVAGMGVEATYFVAGDTLSVDVQKAPPFVGGMIESQLRQFFA